MPKHYVLPLSIIAIVSLVAGIHYFSQQDEAASRNYEGSVYERSYSPSIGPEDAKVTITEFFDPACEACRAFYPYVKEMMQRHPDDVRLVLRYATFHQGSDVAVKVLEAAREQNKYTIVLEALLKDQAKWASHHSPDLQKMWELVAAAGLDIEKAKQVIVASDYDQRLEQENADIRTLKVTQTPTFFVNGKPLPKFGVQELYDLIVSEIEQTRK